MNPIYFIIGTLALLISLLFFGFIAFIWALKQLVTIGDQNDAIITLLERSTVNIWHNPYIGDGYQEDMGNGASVQDRETELRRRIEAYRPSEPLFAKSR
jgi:hypothetical protein